MVTWNFVIILSIMLLGLIWIAIVLFLRFRKRKDPVYLLFFTIFYVYIIGVLYYTLFQYQSLILRAHLDQHLRLRGQDAENRLNLIPLINLRSGDLKTSLLNILMMMPFGFGLPFLRNFRMKRVVVAGALFSVMIEFLQWITGWMANITFRIADINDVLFNTGGVAIGYMLFVWFIRIFLRAFPNGMETANPVLRYIATRPQNKHSSL